MSNFFENRFDLQEQDDMHAVMNMHPDLLRIDLVDKTEFLSLVDKYSIFPRFCSSFHGVIALSRVLMYMISTSKKKNLNKRD